MEVRYAVLATGKTEFDELVADNASIHLEAMSDDTWWMRVEADGEARIIYFTARSKKRIEVWEETE